MVECCCQGVLCQEVFSKIRGLFYDELALESGWMYILIL
jgi:hypothetical protein